MLPDLRFLICGVLFCFLLFAVTGAGVMLPDARTRIGETPEIGRPMMQRSIVEVPAPAPYNAATAVRRAGEPELSREVAGQEAEAAPARPEADTPKSDVERPVLLASDVPPSSVLASGLAAPGQAAGDGLPGSAVVAANQAPGSSPAPDGPTMPDVEAPVQVLALAIAHDDRTVETTGQQVAAAEPPPSPAKQPLLPEVQPFPEEQPAAESGEPVLRFANVPLPLPRPAFFGFHKRAHLFHRRRRVIVVVVRDPSAQTAPAQSIPGQGWQSPNVTASASATDAGRR